MFFFTNIWARELFETLLGFLIKALVELQIIHHQLMVISFIHNKLLTIIYNLFMCCLQKRRKEEQLTTNNYKTSN